MEVGMQENKEVGTAWWNISWIYSSVIQSIAEAAER